MLLKRPDEIVNFCATSTVPWRFDGKYLCVEFTFQSFAATMTFVDAIAACAESLDHHPRMIVDYRTLSIQIFTHDVQGITQKDFDLAFEINTLKEKKYGMVHEK